MSAAASHPRRLAVALVLALLALALGARAAVATAPAGFAVGGVPALNAGSTPLGGLGSTTPLSLDVLLAPRDPTGLAALATAVSTPGSPQYHHYLSVSQFAARFGASTASVATVEADLRAQGLTIGALAPNGLSIPVSADAATASHAFAVSLRRWREPDGRTVFANTSDPRLPPALHGAVTAVLGLDNVPAAAPASLIRAREVLHARRALANQPAISGPTPCAQVSQYSHSGGPYTIDQIADAYGFGSLYAGGDLGAGVTVALYELEPYSAGDIASFQSCFHTSTVVSNVEVDGGPGSSGAGSGETALDIENIIGTAPSSHIDVYQGPNSGSGVIDTLAAIVNQDAAKVISDSWGLCEPESGSGVVSSENTLLAEAATQGQTFLVASGDAGSDGCTDQSGVLAVDDSASQPWATGVGGTSLSSLGPPAGQSVWSGSGGGISTLWRMPSWQAGPGVENSYSSGAPCGAGVGSLCREVPDVSADANPNTGYLIYWNASLYQFGGTSAAAPVWAGLVALAEASGSGGCSPTTPLGFLNPSLYSIAAGGSSASALGDVTSGDNNPQGSGAYPAGTGYDMATGLGTPIANGGSGLVTQLCAALGSGSTGSTGGTGSTGSTGSTGATGPTGGTPAPTVSAVSPADAAPGTVETISGSGFAAGASVSFGGAAAGAVTFLGSGTLRATVPQGSGVVDVTVTDTGGTSVANPADHFTYAPTASIGSPAPGRAYTRTQVVAANYACGASAPGALGCSAPVAAGSPLDTATTGTHQFTVTATDSNGVQTQSTVSYTVVAPPSASVLVPAAGATYVQGQRVLASYSCAASAPLAIAGCSGPVADGAAIDTSTVGEHQFSVSATDADAVSADASVAYDVVAAQPTVSGVRESAVRWLERTGGSSKLPVGTTFSFSLDQTATVTLRFARVLGGRLAGSSCRAGAHRGARCTAHVAAGAITMSAGSGAQTFHFTGSTSSGRLAPGVYVVSITAVAGNGRHSTTKTLRFTVAKA